MHGNLAIHPLNDLFVVVREHLRQLEQELGHAGGRGGGDLVEEGHAHHAAVVALEVAVGGAVVGVHGLAHGHAVGVGGHRGGVAHGGVLREKGGGGGERGGVRGRWRRQLPQFSALLTCWFIMALAMGLAIGLPTPPTIPYGFCGVEDEANG